MKKQLKRTGAINLFDTHFGVMEHPADDDPTWRKSKRIFWAPLMQVFSAIRGVMYQRGWQLQKDPGTHASIREGHWLGRKGELQAVLECCGRSLKVEFFQDVVHENSNGGRYDFDKFKKMPLMMQRQCWAEMVALVRFALNIGYTFDPQSRDFKNVDVDVHSLVPLPIQIRNAMRDRVQYGNDPLDYFNRSWGHLRFKRGDDGWPTNEEIGSYNRKDRDGALITNGDVRYYYHWDKRLGVGRVYTSMNSMWEVWSLNGHTHLSKQASFELFTLGDSDTIHRRKPLTHEQQVSRLRGEIEKASKSGDWKRVATLGKLLDRMAVKQKAAA